MYFDKIDQLRIDEARELAALRTIDDLTAYYSRKYEDNPGRAVILRAPVAAFFGGGTAILADLLSIIDRQQAEIARLTETDQMCADCGKPIYWAVGPEAWYHRNSADMLTCPAAEIEPAKTSA